MPLKIARGLAWPRILNDWTKPSASEQGPEIQSDDDAAPRKKRKRDVAPQDPTSPAGSPALAGEETVCRLANLRLGRQQLLIVETERKIIKKIRDGEYKFTVPIETFEFFHRTAWGVKDSATDIVVNLVLLKRECGMHYGLCVHLNPHDWADKYHHNFLTTDGPWRDMVVCNKASNFLTDALSRELHAFLRQREQEENDILGKVLTKIKEIASSDPTKSCVICGDGLKVTVWRPSPCSKPECRQSLKAWSLETRLSPFLRTPKVLDLLLACLYTGQPTVSKIEGPGGCKFPLSSWNELRGTLDAFPKISDKTMLSDLLLPDNTRAAREELLSWLCTEFEGTLVPTPLSSQVGFGFESEQFLILNGPTMRETQVAEGLKKYGKEAVGGQGAFHGTPQRNLFSILHRGLVNVSGAVWYSSQAHYSLPFNWSRGGSGALTGPKNSNYKDKTVLFGVEAVNWGTALENAHHINSADEATVALRYAFVFAWPAAYTLTLPQGSTLRPVMEKTFKLIRAGNIIKELELESKKTRKSGSEGDS